jgi:hypothetical protein
LHVPQPAQRFRDDIYGHERRLLHDFLKTDRYQVCGSIPHWLHCGALGALLAPHVPHSQGAGGSKDDLRVIRMQMMPITITTSRVNVRDPIPKRSLVSG